MNYEICNCGVPQDNLEQQESIQLVFLAMCCFVIWISFAYFSTWVKQMLMTAPFLMHLGEMLSKKCSAQEEWSGQPNIAGWGQSKSAASIHCLAPALSWSVKTEWRMWRLMKDQGRLDKWDSDFPPCPAYREGGGLQHCEGVTKLFFWTTHIIPGVCGGFSTLYCHTSRGSGFFAV